MSLVWLPCLASAPLVVSFLVYSSYGRMEVLSGFVNSLFLVLIAVIVFIEALDRLVDPPHIDSDRLLIVCLLYTSPSPRDS